jgi:general secretion pathway protein M
MESSSKISQWMTSVSDWLNDQEWFQQIRGKWDELDAQSRMYLKFAMGGGLAALLLFMTLSYAWGVRRQRLELGEKNDLLTLMKNAGDEVRRLRDANAAFNPAEGESSAWGPYLETQAGTAGIEKASMTISPEKTGTGSELAKESMIEVALKHVSIRQIVRLAFQLENGTRPVKLRNLVVDTKADPTGYMDATLHLSAFNLTAVK